MRLANYQAGESILSAGNKVCSSVSIKLCDYTNKAIKNDSIVRRY